MIGGADRADEVRPRDKPGSQCRLPDVQVQVFAVQTGIRAHLGTLLRVRLDDLNARQFLLQVGVDDAAQVRDLARVVGQPLAREVEIDDIDGVDSQRQQGQPPVSIQHDANHADQRHAVLNDRHKTARDQLVDLPDIVDDGRHQFAGLGFLEVALRERLQMGVQLAAHVEHEQLPELRNPDGLEIPDDARRDRHAQNGEKVTTEGSGGKRRAGLEQVEDSCR